MTQHLGRTISGLNLQTNTAIDDRGDSYGFDKLLLATGLRPRRLKNGGEKAIHYRLLHDYHRLREFTVRADRFAIIGSGFIGSELAASLTSNGKQVTMITNGSGIGDALFPADLVEHLNDYYREHGVEVRTREGFAGLDEENGSFLLTTRDGASQELHEITVDGVIAGIGAKPNVEWLRAPASTSTTVSWSTSSCAPVVRMSLPRAMLRRSGSQNSKFAIASNTKTMP